MALEEPSDDRVEVEHVPAVGETAIEFPAEDVIDACVVSELGDGLYRIEGVLLLTEVVGYRDVIEAEPVGSSRIRFVRLARPSGWRTYSFIMPRDHLDSPAGRGLLERVEAAGGYWERVFSGVLVICMPPGCGVDPTPWVLGKPGSGGET